MKLWTSNFVPPEQRGTLASSRAASLSSPLIMTIFSVAKGQTESFGASLDVTPFSGNHSLTWCPYVTVNDQSTDNSRDTPLILEVFFFCSFALCSCVNVLLLWLLFVKKTGCKDTHPEKCSETG